MEISFGPLQCNPSISSIPYSDCGKMFFSENNFADNNLFDIESLSNDATPVRSCLVKTVSLTASHGDIRGDMRLEQETWRK